MRKESLFTFQTRADIPHITLYLLTAHKFFVSQYHSKTLTNSKYLILLSVLTESSRYGARLWAGRWLFGSQWRNRFSFSNSVHTNSDTHPAASLVGILDFAPRILWLQREADCSLLSVVQVTNAWSYAFTPPCFFGAWCLIKHRDKFMLLFFDFW